MTGNGTDLGLEALFTWAAICGGVAFGLLAAVGIGARRGRRAVSVRRRPVAPPVGSRKPDANKPLSRRVRFLLVAFVVIWAAAAATAESLRDLGKSTSLPPPAGRPAVASTDANSCRAPLFASSASMRNVSGHRIPLPPAVKSTEVHHVRPSLYTTHVDLSPDQLACYARAVLAQPHWRVNNVSYYRSDLYGTLTDGVVHMTFAQAVGGGYDFEWGIGMA